MSLRKIKQLAFVILLIAFACQKEYSGEGFKQTHVDTLPPDYPFATGYCKDGGVFLDVTIFDTIDYVPSNTSPLPASLLLDMPVPGNQASQRSCAAWATIYSAGSYYEHITLGKPYSDTGNLSPKFTYNQIAKGNCICTSLLDNLYLLKTEGACSLADMPYIDTECVKQPDSLQRMQAERYKIKGWQKVNLHDLLSIKRAIREKKPVIFAIRIDDGFEQLKPSRIWKERSGTLKEGHALVISGFDDTKKALRVINSWSTGWADGGFTWIDYDFFLHNVIEGGYVLI